MPSAGVSGKKRQHRGYRLISGDPTQVFVCSCCDEILPVGDFRVRTRKDGRTAATSHCRVCWLRWRKEYREDHSTVSRQQYSLENLRRAMKRYGLTELDYFTVLERQKGGCAICGGPPNGRGRFHIDHDHATGALRGLLCHGCNTGLGAFRDNDELLIRAASYVIENQPSLSTVASSRGGKSHS